MSFSTKDFFNLRRKLRVWSHLLKKSLTENFTFCAVITASLLKEVCHDVRMEAILRKLTGKRFEQRTANTLDETGLDVAAREFTTADQITFFGIRVFY